MPILLLLLLHHTNMIPFCSHDKTKYKNTFLKGDESIFSNWYPSKFSFTTADFQKSLGIKLLPREFENVEQGMMYGKAALFKDYDVATQIMESGNPKDVRSFGRKVKDYDDDVWSNIRYEYTKALIMEKFRQNKDLLIILKKTGNMILVEGAWYDKIWGVGLKDTDPAIHDVKNWKGENLLGKALMEVRDLL